MSEQKRNRWARPTDEEWKAQREAFQQKEERELADAQARQARVLWLSEDAKQVRVAFMKDGEWLITTYTESVQNWAGSKALEEFNERQRTAKGPMTTISLRPGENYSE
jgi:hypothetical protein